MKKYLFLVIMLSGGYLTGFAQTLSQTKTASRFNDFQGVDAYVQGGAQYVAYDDNLYAYTRKLTTHRGYASLVLQGFGFAIPPGATIDNIVVSVRRFKSGRSSIRDHFASLVKSPNLFGILEYGVLWQHQDNYPDIEAETIYSESGSGIGGDNQLYKWTPAMINDRDFGLRIDVAPPVGPGPVVVYYDLVELTVEYSLP